MKIVTTLYLCSPNQTAAKAPGLLSEKKKKRTDTVTENNSRKITFIRGSAPSK